MQGDACSISDAVPRSSPIGPPNSDPEAGMFGTRKRGRTCASDTAHPWWLALPCLLLAAAPSPSARRCWARCTTCTKMRRRARTRRASAPSSRCAAGFSFTVAKLGGHMSPCRTPFGARTRRACAPPSRCMACWLPAPHHTCPSQALTIPPQPCAHHPAPAQTRHGCRTTSRTPLWWGPPPLRRARWSRTSGEPLLFCNKFFP